MQDTEPGNFPNSETLLNLISSVGNASTKVSAIADYVSFVRHVSSEWQDEDLRQRERDEKYTLNDARIVGQVWFRGQPDCALSLKPGLYREDTWKELRKHASNVSTSEITEDDLFDALFDLEHDQRIDFTNYGHLLNESNQARTAIDWYFLMQHHGIPTRLLDWTTNALAGLFFSLEAYSRKNNSSGKDEVAVWMVDAYWLADHLSDEWGSPILPYSEDALRYVPTLERLIDKMSETRALIPKYPMPIEPPAMHPRVAAQEGRFVIFGRTRELLDQKIRLKPLGDCKIEALRLKQIRYNVSDVNRELRELAHLGVSKRTLFPDLAGLAEFVRWKHFHKIGSERP